MLELAGIVAFALLIAGSIALHELGHLVPAKRFGVKVTEYMIGFGPTLWSRRRGETRYGLKAVPLGGYIRMIGMLPPAADGTQRSMTTGRFATLISDARRTAEAEIAPGEEARAFYRLPVRKRVVIMLGGPLMNLALAFVLFAIVLVGIGTAAPSTTINTVASCTPTSAAGPAAPLPSGECPTGSAQAPAAAAGLQAGDTLVALDGEPVRSWADANAFIRAHGGRDVTFTVERDGEQVQVPVSVAVAQRPALDADGNPTSGVVSAGYVGIGPGTQWERQPWSSVPQYMWDITTQSVAALLTLPVRLFDLVRDTLIGGEARSPDSPVSVVGVSRLGGDIAAMDEPIQGKIATFLALGASLNLFLFLFNLLPIPPLDGGHIASALYEAARRKLAQLRGHRDPGPVDTARLLPVSYVVAAALLLMGVIVIWADLVKPVSFG